MQKHGEALRGLHLEAVERCLELQVHNSNVIYTICAIVSMQVLDNIADIYKQRSGNNFSMQTQP